MALIINTTDPTSGAPVTYAHIGGYTVYARDRIVRVTLSGYASEQARRDGKSPLLTFPEQDFSLNDVGDDPTRAALYAAMLTRIAEIEANATGTGTVKIPTEYDLNHPLRLLAGAENDL